MMRALILGCCVVPAVALSNPPRIEFTTLLGAPGSSLNSSAMDREGYLYAAGATPQDAVFCTDMPPAPARTQYGFVTKLAPGGNWAAWTVCFPGEATAVAFNPEGGLFAAIAAAGSSSNIVRLDPSTGKTLSSAALASVSVKSMVVHGSGDVYIGGLARKGLRTTPGAAHLELPCASRAGFVAKLRGPVPQLVTYTVCGVTNSVAADGSGALWAASTLENQLGRLGVFQKFSAEGVELENFHTPSASTFRQLPESGSGLGVMVDAQDNFYYFGTVSQEFVSVPGPLGTVAFGPRSEAGKLVRLTPSGAGLTLYTDPGQSIRWVAADSSGIMYVGISGWSADGPVCGGGSIPRYNRIAVLSADGSRLLDSCYLGAEITGVHLAGPSQIMLSGTATWDPFLATPGAFISSRPLGPTQSTAFATKLDFTREPGPVVRSILNSASFAPGEGGSVAPGELVTIFGQGFMPDRLKVGFDGIAAPILFANSNQINAIVPFKAGGPSRSATVIVQSGQESMGPYLVPVAQSALGFFAVGKEPILPLLALNQDGTVNSRENPAAGGSVVVLYATGAGVFDRPLADGEPGPMTPPFPVPAQPISAGLWFSFGPYLPYPGKAADVLFAGQAPGLVAGVVQLNIRVPTGLPNAGANAVGFVLGIFIGGTRYEAAPVYVQ